MGFIPGFPWIFGTLPALGSGRGSREFSPSLERRNSLGNSPSGVFQAAWEGNNWDSFPFFRLFPRFWDPSWCGTSPGGGMRNPFLPWEAKEPGK